MHVSLFRAVELEEQQWCKMHLVTNAAAGLSPGAVTDSGGRVRSDTECDLKWRETSLPVSQIIEAPVIVAMV